MKTIIRTKDVAERLGVSTQTVSAWSKWLRYEIPHDKTGKVYTEMTIQDLENIRDRIKAGERLKVLNYLREEEMPPETLVKNDEIAVCLQMIETLRLQLNVLEGMVKAIK